jgi:hypothetical protein
MEKNKTLTFSYPLPKLVLNGEKNTTRRINDDKDISVWDSIDLLDRENNFKIFWVAKIIRVKFTTFWNLSHEDKEWHEKFTNDKEMYRTYTKYYWFNVTENTALKVIKFKLL